MSQDEIQLLDQLELPGLPSGLVLLGVALLVDFSWALFTQPFSKVITCDVHFIWNVPCKVIYAIFVAVITALIVMLIGATLLGVILLLLWVILLLGRLAGFSDD
jgi:hypothetical protein